MQALMTLGHHDSDHLVVFHKTLDVADIPGLNHAFTTDTVAEGFRHVSLNLQTKNIKDKD